MARSRVCLSLFALALAGLPSGAAHGTLEAAELEVLLLEDETTDLMAAWGGYDIAQVLLGEAHMPDVGAGAAGDGVYFRTTLYGDLSSPLAGPARVVFAFDTPGGSVERWIETSDGATFTTDFDALVTESGDGSVDVQRAFVSYASLGVAPGETISNFQLRSYSDGELRDVAPGGVFLPEPAGVAEVEMGESRVVAAEHALAGVGGYASVAVTDEGGGVWAIAVTNLLKEGAQHAMLGDVPAQQGWRVEALGETAASLKPGESATFRVRLLPDAPAAALPFDVLTDVGGRVGLVAENVENVPTLRVEGTFADNALVPAAVAEVTAPGLLALGAALAAPALLRRR